MKLKENAKKVWSLELPMLKMPKGKGLFEGVRERSTTVRFACGFYLRLGKWSYAVLQLKKPPCWTKTVLLVYHRSGQLQR